VVGGNVKTDDFNENGEKTASQNRRRGASAEKDESVVVWMKNAILRALWSFLT
jgi:hypothetical protein